MAELLPWEIEYAKPWELDWGTAPTAAPEQPLPDGGERTPLETPDNVMQEYNPAVPLDTTIYKPADSIDQARIAEEARSQQAMPEPIVSRETSGETEGPMQPSLLQQRGRQVGAGLAEVGAAIAEGQAISDALADKSFREMAPGKVADALRSIRQIDATLRGGNVSAQRQAELLRIAGEAKLEVESWQELQDSGSLSADQRPGFKTAADIRAWAGKTFGVPDPNDDSFWGKAAYGLGNTLGFVPAAMVPGVGLPLVAGIGGRMNAASIYKEAKAAGADESTALEASRWGFAVGTTEALPFFAALKLLPPALKGRVTNRVLRAFTEVAINSGDEAAQEGFSGVMNNLITQKLWDPKRGTWANVGEQMLVGAILGPLAAVPAMVQPSTKGDELVQKVTEKPVGQPDNLQVPRTDLPPPTKDDRDSAIPTQRIQEGKAIMDAAAAGLDFSAPTANVTGAEGVSDSLTPTQGGGGIDGTAPATPNVDVEEARVLRQAGWTPEDIADMNDDERVQHVQDAVRAGVKDVVSPDLTTPVAAANVAAPVASGVSPVGSSEAQGVSAPASRPLTKYKLTKAEGGEVILHVDTTPEFQASAAAVEADLRQQLDSFGLKGTKLAVPLAITQHDGTGTLTGESAAFFDPQRGLIAVALRPDSIKEQGGRTNRQRLGHEALHALRPALRPTEWAAVSREVPAEYMERAKAEYPDLPAETQVEEAIAEWFGDWHDGSAPAKGFIRTAFERIKSVLGALRSALHGQGFTTAKQVFRELSSGEVGARLTEVQPKVIKPAAVDSAKAKPVSAGAAATAPTTQPAEKPVPASKGAPAAKPTVAEQKAKLAARKKTKKAPSAAAVEKAQKDFFSYKPASETPTLAEAKAAGAIAETTTDAEWGQMTPGMKREIVRTTKKKAPLKEAKARGPETLEQARKDLLQKFIAESKALGEEFAAQDAAEAKMTKEERERVADRYRPATGPRVATSEGKDVARPERPKVERPTSRADNEPPARPKPRPKLRVVEEFEVGDKLGDGKGFGVIKEARARPGEGLVGILAHHGSPHDFERFDFSKIGTGEGNQTYGFGGYFAENDSVAKSYQASLAGSRLSLTEPDGSRAVYSAHNAEAIAEALELKGRSNYVGQYIVNEMRRGMDLDAAIAAAREDYSHFPSEIVQRAVDAVMAANINLNVNGHIYTVKIDADPEDFLDWNAPLSETSGPIADFLKGNGKTAEDALAAAAANDKAAEELLGTDSGTDAYYKAQRAWDRMRKAPLVRVGELIRRLRTAKNQFGYDAASKVQGSSLYTALGDKKEAADALRALGYPGIRYRDQGSRTPVAQADLQRVLADYDRQIANAQRDIEGMGGATRAEYQGHIDRLIANRAEVARKIQPTYNYVIFDDSRVTIVAKDGEARIKEARARGSESFDRWFGASKVVDKAGEPLIVHHSGSFDERLDIPAGAMHFGTKAAAEERVFGKRVEEAVNDIGVYETDDGGWHWESRVENLTSEELGLGPFENPAKAMTSGRNNIQHQIENADIDYDELNLTSAYLKIENPMRTRDNGYGMDEWPAAIELAKHLGHDGIVYRNEVEDKGKDSWIVFSPTQVKSVNNRGTFDPNSPNILEATARPAERIATANAATGLMPAAAGQASFTPPAKNDLGIAIATRLHDTMDRLRAMQKQIEKARGSKIPEPMDAHLATELYHTRAVASMKALMADEVAPITREMKLRKVNMDDLSVYLIAKHAPELNAEMKRENYAKWGDHGSGVTDGAAQSILNDLQNEGKIPGLEAVAKRVDKLLENDLRRRRQAGLISGQDAVALHAKFQHYVPFGWAQREDGSYRQVGSLGQGYDVRGVEARAKLAAHTAEVSPLTQAVAMAQEGIVRVEKNRVTNRLYRLAVQHPHDEYLKVVTEPGLDPNVVSVKIGGKNRYIKVDPDLSKAIKMFGGAHAGEVLNVMRQLTNAYSRLQTTYNMAFWPVNFTADLTESGIKTIGEKQKGLPRKYAKNLFPAFGSLVRETAGLGHSQKWGKLMKEWEAAGGKMEFMGLHDIDSIEKALGKMSEDDGKIHPLRGLLRAPEKFFNALEILSGPFENASRLATYAAARELGVSPERAARASLEAAGGNYTKKGSYTAAAGALYPFFNAAEKGTAAMIRLAKNRKVQAIFASAIALGAAQAALWVQMYPDDEDPDKIPLYYRIDPWQRSRNIAIPTGTYEEEYTDENGVKKSRTRLSVKYIRLPYILRPMWVAGEQAALAKMGVVTPQEAAKTTLRAALTAFNPIGGDSIAFAASPLIGDPILALSKNETEFGTPLHPDRTAPGEMSDPIHANTYSTGSTDPNYIKLAQWLNRDTGGDNWNRGWADMYPGQIEYLTQFVGGGLWRFLSSGAQMAEDLKDGVPLDVNNIPIVNGFAGHTSHFAEDRLFYDVLKPTSDSAKKRLRDNKQAFDDYGTGDWKEIQEHAAELGAEVVQGKNIKWEKSWTKIVDDAAKDIADKRHEMNAIRMNTEMSRPEQAVRLKDLQAQIEETMIRARSEVNTRRSELIK